MKFSRLNLLTSNGLFFLLLYAFNFYVFFVFIKNITTIPAIGIITIFILEILLCGIIIIPATTKVVITDKGIRYKSLFKEVIIEWNQIKSYGVYITGSNVKSTLNPREYDKFKWAAQKFIFITEKENYKPKLFRIRPKKGFAYIDFHYRKNAMEIIEDKMTKIKSLLPINGS